MRDKIFFILGTIILIIAMSMCVVFIDLAANTGDDRVAIVTDKYEVGGAYFVKVVVPVDADTYIGLDVSDECTFESE